MTSWVCYTRKVLSSALTSIAGELEQTAQNFNDAVQNLSHSGPASQEQNVLQEPDVCDRPERNLTSAPEEAAALTARNVDGRAEDTQTEASHSQHSKTSNVPGLGTSSSHSSSAQKSFPRPAPRPLSSSHLHSHRQPSVSRPITIATTSQPEPLGPASLLPPLHSRLSHSSPSLSPLSHEGECSGASSDAEDDHRSPETLAAAGSSFDTPGWVEKPRAIRADNSRPITLSLSTPCLVHVHKILPSCKKTFNCASTLPSVSPVSARDHQSARESNSQNVSDHGPKPFKVLQAHRSNVFCSRSPSGPVAVKKPGRVVVVSEPLSSVDNRSCRLVNDVYRQPEDKTEEPSDQQQSLHLSEICNNPAHTGHREGLPAPASHHSPNRDNGPSQTHCSHPAVPRSGSPQDQMVIRTVKSSIQIEREARPQGWPMLAPLARVLTFAYSQVVNALLLLQDEESPTSSVKSHSRSSSMCRGTNSHIVSSAELFPLSNKESVENPVKVCVSAASDAVPTLGSHHRRQMSQLSLAGSTLSSESFEILDAASDGMETSSNFVYIGDDAAGSDILYEYHLFPSKSAHVEQRQEQRSPAPTTQASSDGLGSSPARRDSNVDLMTSSSADFAHFDFSELIADRRDNQLNPVTWSARSSDTVSPDLVTLTPGDAAASSDHGRGTLEQPDGCMFESFVVLESDRSALD